MQRGQERATRGQHRSVFAQRPLVNVARPVRTENHGRCGARRVASCGRPFEVGERQPFTGERAFQSAGQATRHPDVPAQAGRVGDDRPLGCPGEVAAVEDQTRGLRHRSVDGELHS